LCSGAELSLEEKFRVIPSPQNLRDYMIRVAKRRNTGGGAYISAPPVSKSVGTFIVSSIEKVMRFRNGCAGTRGPAGRLIFSMSIHRRVPSAWQWPGGDYGEASPGQPPSSASVSPSGIPVIQQQWQSHDALRRQFSKVEGTAV
jgi:hypothetical protein